MYNYQLVTATKDLICDGCGREIKPGEKYFSKPGDIIDKICMKSMVEKMNTPV
jgi:hypothetical protein